MNDQELALVLERDYQSLASDKVKVNKVTPNKIQTRYLIDILDSVSGDSIQFTFKVYNDPDKLVIDWTFDLDKYTGDQHIAYKDDGFTYLAITKSTVHRHLRDILVQLTNEIIFSYIRQLESDLKLITNALEGVTE